MKYNRALLTRFSFPLRRSARMAMAMQGLALSFADHFFEPRDAVMEFAKQTKSMLDDKLLSATRESKTP